MPRNPKYAALSALSRAVKTQTRVTKAAAAAREAVHVAAVAAVEAGAQRGEVATIMGVTNSRVGQIPGMPPGKNVHKGR